MVRIKICGITRAEDARLAARLGAWAVGLVFYEESPRNVGKDEARKILRGLDPHVLKVGVFVNPTPEEVLRCSSAASLDAVQLHGDESPSLCLKIREKRLRMIKAFRMQGPQDLDVLPEYEEVCDFFLLDSFTQDKRGGTGLVFDWSWAKQAIEKTGRPVIVSGGLSSENLISCIQEVKPYAVDVSSGVETAPGIKSAELLHDLFRQSYST
ncbi:MAG: phosphoribosylanthranilate isomerase [Candidatus Omnitrophica bacterium]|nr:phosphoribosylanthranilate isomerase [Candidatus Omnitrophota bacterium]